MADYYRFHPPWWVRVLKSCYTFAKECTAYTLPNKGMVTQQREVSLSLSPFHHGTMLSVRRTSALLRFSDSTRDFFPPLAPISSIRFNPSLPFSPLSPHHLSIVAATIVEQASWPTRIFDRRPLRSLWPKHMFSGGGCRSALSKALRWDRWW